LLQRAIDEYYQNQYTNELQLVADNYNAFESYVFNIETNQWENQWGYTAGVWRNLKRKVLVSL